jgi:hypothetical protein
LREVCAQSGFRLQPIDLRWGVSEAAGIERQTLRICFDELERCRRLSPDFFLVIQLGERYGTRILPPELPIAVVTRLLPQLSPRERRRFADAYVLDENAAPSEYVLRRAEGHERRRDAARRRDEALRQMLVDAARVAQLDEADRAPFAASATEREIRLGLLDAPVDALGDAGVLCAMRSFRGKPRGSQIHRFVERAAAIVRFGELCLVKRPGVDFARADGSGDVHDKEIAVIALGVAGSAQKHGELAANGARFAVISTSARVRGASLPRMPPETGQR